MVCDTVRYYVALYGAAAAIEWARSHGWDRKKIDAAARCVAQ